MAKLSVKAFDGGHQKTITLEVNTTHTIGEIKKMIQDVEGVPIDRQRLLHCGKQMDLEIWTIGDYAGYIEDGKTVLNLVVLPPKK